MVVRFQKSGEPIKFPGMRFGEGHPPVRKATRQLYPPAKHPHLVVAVVAGNAGKHFLYVRRSSFQHLHEAPVVVAKHFRKLDLVVVGLGALQ